MFINRSVLRRIGWNEAENGNLFLQHVVRYTMNFYEGRLVMFHTEWKYFTNIKILVKLGNDEILLREKFT